MKTMTRHLFLDLEDTIITPNTGGWLATDVINQDRVRNFIQREKFDKIHIFSFAIWHQADLESFNRDLRRWLEIHFQAKFDIIPTVQNDIIPAVEKSLGLGKNTVSLSDMVEFLGKGGAFRHFVKGKFNDQSVALLDDSVDNETIIWPDNNQVARIINIKDI
jgi:hypothetical protein